MDPCDVFIIGGTPVRHLAPSSKCVLLFERGDAGRQVCASGRCLPVWQGSGHIGVEHRLAAAQVDNLYFVDTNVSNPALTAMADALPAGDHLLSQLA